MRLLLLSNSTTFGGTYLGHAKKPIVDLFAKVKRIAFVPFALADQEGYFGRARAHFETLGIEVERVLEGTAGRTLAESADGIFVGGGNTFRLLDKLQRSSLLEPIRARVLEGMPYLGSSAGTGIAAPTIMTTNDMPIVKPATFESLGLVPFQMNCHYLDPERGSRHMGETRETRIREFHEENDTPVVGLREGSWLEVEGTAGSQVARLGGPHHARYFVRGAEPRELSPGTDVNAQGG
ncbi:MAG TPA: dipeptidase PepE [Candidatus Polarisedimenticolia bacterium]|nr:dipeptidase PepE [Candidatus Polarisedimenticolia bacterium]